MKKLLIGLTLGLSLTLGAFALTPVTAQAGMWEKLSGMVAKTVPSEMFAIEAQGANLRAYLFPVEAQGKTCLFVSGTKKGGLTCWDNK